MLCPPVGDVTLRRLMPVLVGERVLDGVVLLVGHAQDALVGVVHVARPSDDGKEYQKSEHDNGNLCQTIIPVSQSVPVHWW